MDHRQLAIGVLGAAVCLAALAWWWRRRSRWHQVALQRLIAEEVAAFEAHQTSHHAAYAPHQRAERILHLVRTKAAKRRIRLPKKISVP